MQRAAIAAALGGIGIVDMLAVDATQGLFPASAAEILPSTDDGHGGFKLTAVLSVLFQRLHQRRSAPRALCANAAPMPTSSMAGR
ncbi:MAG: hypothetical protein A3K18_00880 [Lentisphaerae bacterium RIFOXYA12_64_32]|nr:MAG: hypothetical protein A3K18_00880 [Lentisphaerae bacterium RIFOXYA12_64_32]